MPLIPGGLDWDEDVDQDVDTNVDEETDEGVWLEKYVVGLRRTGGCRDWL
jgi:hypothetical protein